MDDVVGSETHIVQNYYCPAAWGTGPEHTASPSPSLFREETKVPREGAKSWSHARTS